MASSFRFDPRARAALRGIGEAGLRDAAEKLLAASKSDVPVESGALRNSGYVDVDGDTAVVGYHDWKAPVVHEVHRTQGKFLEQPFNRMRGDLVDEIADSVRRKLR